MNNVPEQVKLAGDGLAVLGWASVLMGTITNFLGLLAAIASLIWVCIRLYETQTFKLWWAKRKAKKQ